ncbi:TMEM175 family protein [Ligilactobacillus salivarius]|uniref:TMEM175 family protein n=1 Tax=Ligilactobacillus salivarius TaxID=1624 RepID=UPI0025A3C240|nr:TMEM175 family protein [Ligilactobacillus salivarius]MDM8263574.1 TMEM175 family protein [Ligilactobacillus salivarius]MDM8273108.1 TMEM175 family protein [Ligilactobacillus salivarius]
MPKNRMEAFSDGVLAIIITIMVLELHIPDGVTFDAIKSIIPTFIAYILSYLYVGIYWNNHHHLVSTLSKVSGKILWFNLHWLFWMSLLPMATKWLGAYPFRTAPTFVYGFILFMCAISYYLLQIEVLKQHKKHSKLKQIFGRDLKGKISIILYLTITICALFLPILSYVLLFVPTLLWVIPDRRIEKFYNP